MRIGLAAVGILSTPAAALACSGPGAANAIARAEHLGWALFALTVALAAAVLLSRRLHRRGLRTYGWFALVLLHPGWWMSARVGDCGRMLTAGSIAATVLAAVILAFVYRRARPPAVD